MGELVDSDDEEEDMTPEMAKLRRTVKEHDEYMKQEEFPPEENDQDDQDLCQKDEGICGAIGVRTDEAAGRNAKRWFEHGSTLASTQIRK